MGIYDSLLSLHPGVLVFLLALIVNIFSTLVYKKVTDQKEIKKLKAKQKELQKEAKKLQSQPEKAMKKQKEMMEISGKMMRQSFRPMLYTMIPLLLLFAWINASLIYEPLSPEEEFTVTAEYEKGFTGEVTLSSQPGLNIQDPTKTLADGAVTWLVSGSEGNYFLDVDPSGMEDPKKIVVTEGYDYENPEQEYDGVMKKLIIGNERVRPFGDLSLFGWVPGMLGAYILLSIILSIVLRKAMNVA